MTWTCICTLLIWGTPYVVGHIHVHHPHRDMRILKAETKRPGFGQFHSFYSLSCPKALYQPCDLLGERWGHMRQWLYFIMRTRASWRRTWLSVVVAAAAVFVFNFFHILLSPKEVSQVFCCLLKLDKQLWPLSKMLF